MTINTWALNDEEFEQWVASQDMNPAPSVAVETTSPAMTTAAPSALGAGTANDALQSIINQQALNQQLDGLAQTFSVNQQLNGSANMTSPFPTFQGTSSLGTLLRSKQSSSSETKKEWSAVLKPVTSPVKGQLTASMTMSAAPTKPSRSSRKKVAQVLPDPNAGQW